MANDGKFLNLTGGVPTQETAVTTSAGAGDANKIPRLDAAGKLDSTVMPAGVGAEALSIVTSEALAAGDFVNIHDATGAKVRKADATTTGKEAHGFVLAAAASGASVTVNFDGFNTGRTGMTPGAKQFLAITAGASSASAPAVAGQVAQVIGYAVSATSMVFHPLSAITIA